MKTRNIYCWIIALLVLCAGAVWLLFPVSPASVAGEKTAPAAIAIAHFHFKPDTLKVPVGTTVTWINNDDVPHTVLSADKKTFSSPPLDSSAKFSFTFTATGTNSYFCSMHPHMKGRIIVQ